jgi:hypothetical protein
MVTTRSKKAAPAQNAGRGGRGGNNAQASTSTGRGGRGNGRNTPASGGAPRKVTFLTVKEAFEKLGRINLETADEDGGPVSNKPVNRSKTVKNKV